MKRNRFLTLYCSLCLLFCAAPLPRSFAQERSGTEFQPISNHPIRDTNTPFSPKDAARLLSRGANTTPAAQAGVTPEKPEIGPESLFGGDHKMNTSAALSPDRFVVAYVDDRSFVMGRVGEVKDGSRIEYGSPVVFDDSGRNNNLAVFTLIGLNSDQFVLIYRDGDTSECRAHLGNVSGNVIRKAYEKWHDALMFNNDYIRHMSGARVSGNSFVLSYSAIDSQNKRHKVYTIIGEVTGDKLKFRPQILIAPIDRREPEDVDYTAVIALSEYQVLVFFTMSDLEGPMVKAAYLESIRDQWALNQNMRPTILRGSFLENLSAQPLSRSKFLLSYKTREERGDKDYYYANLVVGSCYSNDIFVEKTIRFDSDPYSGVHLNAPSVDTFALVVRRPNDNNTYLKLGRIEGDAPVFSQEVPFDTEGGYTLTLAKLTDYRFVIVYAGNGGASRLARIPKPASPIIADSTPSEIKAVSISPDKFVVAFVDAEERTGLARVGLIRDGQIRFGDVFKFSNVITSSLSATAVSPDSFALTFRSNARGNVIVGRVSDDDIAFGPAASVPDTGNVTDLNIARVSNNLVAIAYKGSTNRGVLAGAVVNGNSLSFVGGEYLIDQKDYKLVNLALGPMGGRVIIAYSVTPETGDRVEKYFVRAADVTVDGISFPAAPATVQRFQDPAVAGLSNNRFVLAFRAHTENHMGKAVAGDVSANGSITLGPAVTVNQAATRPISIAPMSVNGFSVLYGEGEGSVSKPALKVKVLTATVDGTAITLGSPATVSEDQSRFVSIASLAESSFVAAFTNLNARQAVGKIGQVNVQNRSIVIR